MKEYPILFNTEMVQAILRGEKTQTRRPAMKDRRCLWQAGDILYVREAFAVSPYSGIVNYRADYDDHDAREVKWKPSIHMPREFSRLFLEVDAVRIEPIQNMTEEDARAEGVKPFVYQTHITAFATLWDKIYEKRGLVWAGNPPVEVTEFHIKEPA